MDYRFHFMIESLYAHSRQISNDFINQCYNSEEEIEVNRDALNSFILQYKNKNIDALKIYISELSEKADRKRVDNRKKPNTEELTEFDLYLTELKYLAGYKGSKGYIKKEFVFLLKQLFDSNQEMAKLYKNHCSLNKEKPDIIKFINWKSINI